METTSTNPHPHLNRNSDPKINLLPSHPTDIPSLSAISAAAFKTDTHTQLNYLAKSQEFDMSPALESWMSLPSSRCVVLKAVLTGQGENDNEGEIVGWVCWVFKGFVEGKLDGELETEEKEEQKEGEKQNTFTSPIQLELQAHGDAIRLLKILPRLTPIERLNKITNTSMAFWQSYLSPSPSSKHLILTAITISPIHQGHGIGSALIDYGTKIADRHGAYCWVSSSDGGYRVFEKAGFGEVGRLELVLDEFAGAGGGGEVWRNEGIEDGRWGVYVWRYMRREAKS